MHNATLSSALSNSAGRPSGFDYLRPILAIGVIANHANFICYGANDLGSVATAALYLSYLVVPAFFALSGFLVAGSLERCQTLVSFLGLRVFRIFPALVVEVVISALIIGTVFTELPLRDYFSDPLFTKYFLNILGEPQYHLPGVFISNPTSLVNGQIWTIPYELVCYIVLSIVAVSYAYRHSSALIVVLAVLYGGQVLNTLLRPNLTYAGPTGLICVICFVAGVTLFRFRATIPFRRSWFLICATAVIALLYLPSGIRFIAVPISYITIYLGLCNPPKLSILDKGDYSYGIYLYGFPIQQALFSTSDFFRTPFSNGFFSVLLATFFAVLSWHLVEFPFLRRKKIVYVWEQRLIEGAKSKYLSPIFLRTKA